MYIVCLDLEGVLVPEIWIAFSRATGIEELSLTTRDVPDYDALMKGRIRILSEHRLKLADIQRVVSGVDPLEGAFEFLQALRAKTQVLILSDTFTQFARPLMEKLAWPTLFCNSLVVDVDGSIVDYELRQRNGKCRAVEAMKSIGFRVLAAGDSYNDLSMIRSADNGILFRPPEAIVGECPDLPVVHTYGEFTERIRAVIG